MACDKCGARTIEIIKPGESCPLCEAREKVKAQALQIVKLREKIITAKNSIDEGTGSKEQIISFVWMHLKEALALDTNAEKMVAEIRIETLKTWALNRCPTCRKEGPAKGRLYHSGFWHQYGNSKREYQCCSTEIWEAYYHETLKIKKYQAARARSEGK